MTKEMKTELQEIEHKLHELKPAKVPESLNAQIEKIFEI